MSQAAIRAAVRQEIDDWLMERCTSMCARRPACLSDADAEAAVDGIMANVNDWCAGQVAHAVTPRPGPHPGRAGE